MTEKVNFEVGHYVLIMKHETGYIKSIENDRYICVYPSASSGHGFLECHLEHFDFPSFFNGVKRKKECIGIPTRKNKLINL